MTDLFPTLDSLQREARDDPDLILWRVNYYQFHRLPEIVQRSLTYQFVPVRDGEDLVGVCRQVDWDSIQKYL